MSDVALAPTFPPPVHRLPQFLGLGAMRCGTTTLWQYLKADERLFLPEQKEVHFFDDVRGAFAEGVESYERIFQSAKDGQICGEFTPSYLYLAEVPGRIQQVLDSPKFLVVLRDPVARAWSHYQFSVIRGDEPFSFERALDREGTRLATGELMARLHYSYVDRGLYVDQLERYEAIFGRESLCVVLLEELQADPATVLKTVYAHLGLDISTSSNAKESVHRNRTQSFPRSPRLHVWTKSWEQAHAQSTSMGSRGLRRLAKELRQLNEAARLPVMTGQARARLEKEFERANERLSEWLGRKVPWGEDHGKCP